MNSMSRRTLAKGAIWAAPVAAVTTIAPAYASSTNCGDIIDAAFKALTADGALLAFWNEAPQFNADWAEKIVDFNLTNNTDVDITIDNNSRLQIQFDMAWKTADGTAPSTALDVTGAGYAYALPQATEVTRNGTTTPATTAYWAIEGNTQEFSVLRGNRPGVTNTYRANFTIPAAATVLDATLLALPTVRPSWSGLIAQYPELKSCPDAHTYYQQKAGIPIRLVIGGPSIQGSPAQFGVVDTGELAPIVGGFTVPWNVGDSYWSDSIGNFTYDRSTSKAPWVSRWEESRNGVF